MKSNKYQPRFYRKWHQTQDLVSFQVRISESDLHIRALTDLSRLAEESLATCRLSLERYIQKHPDFQASLLPYPAEPFAPNIVCAMSAAADRAGVGPMAGVAGAVAEQVGRELLKESSEIIVENGGDIFIHSARSRRVALYAGHSLPPLCIEIAAAKTPCGICTSSGLLGHSLSLGKADCATVIAESAVLADAVATACGNKVQSADDIEECLAFALSVSGVRGVILCVEQKIGILGEVTLCDP